MGHCTQSRNFLANERAFRQDSTFLYFVGISRPGVAVVIEADGLTTLFLPAVDPGAALWTGDEPAPSVWKALSGADHCRDINDLISGRYLTLPLCETHGNSRAAALTGQALDPTNPGESGSPDLRAAVIRLRMARDDEEVAEQRAAIAVTALAQRAAMQATHPGVTDTAIEALIGAIFALHGMDAAYRSIVTARGEILHGHADGGKLSKGQLLLVDAGAESKGGYAADITRTWPVNGRFDARQKAVYSTVLEANRAATAVLAPGVPYSQAHIAAARVLCSGLVDLDLLCGDVDGLVEQGAHAVFFPHGVGHLLGLDVHDMELLGDDVGYEPGVERSSQFGLSFLRLQRPMREGVVVTIEPGIYFVPGVIGDQSLRESLGDSVNWQQAEQWIGFGGIRIEDDVLITSSGHEVLSAAIPSEVAQVEALVGSGRPPSERLLDL
jgi:Xaa-Pro aminopeptidase